jgi:hypothetical protein
MAMQGHRETGMDKQLQAKVNGKADVHLHNHPANSAYWFKTQIEKRLNPATGAASPSAT